MKRAGPLVGIAAAALVATGCGVADEVSPQVELVCTAEAWLDAEPADRAELWSQIGERWGSTREPLVRAIVDAAHAQQADDAAHLMRRYCDRDRFD